MLTGPLTCATSTSPEDGRRVANGEQVARVAQLALANKPSVDFTGYWQRHKAA